MNNRGLLFEASYPVERKDNESEPSFSFKIKQMQAEIDNLREKIELIMDELEMCE